jgi:hypothetical protein
VLKVGVHDGHYATPGDPKARPDGTSQATLTGTPRPVEEPDRALDAHLFTEALDYLGRCVIGVVNEYQLPAARSLSEGGLETERQRAYVERLVAGGDDDRQRARRHGGLAAASAIGFVNVDALSGFHALNRYGPA